MDISKWLVNSQYSKLSEPIYLNVYVHKLLPKYEMMIKSLSLRWWFGYCTVRSIYPDYFSQLSNFCSEIIVLLLIWKSLILWVDIITLILPNLNITKCKIMLTVQIVRLQ